MCGFDAISAGVWRPTGPCGEVADVTSAAPSGRDLRPLVVAAVTAVVSLGLVLGGATTHLLDRLLREPGFARGRVVDFIDYFDLFIGNVADIALVGGIFWAALLHLRGVELDGSRGGDGKETADTPDTAEG